MASDSTVFVDTNVLLYSIDARDPVKRDAAGAWIAHCWREERGRISTQVLNELYANLRRVAPNYERKAARQLVACYRAWTPWIVDDSTIDLAWQLEDRVAINYWDALMVAAAQQQACSYLLTEDLQHGQKIDDLQIVNPFRMNPNSLETSS
jgi:predicted nucleic acid-binding protein